MYNLGLILVFQMVRWFPRFEVATAQFFSYVKKKSPAFYVTRRYVTAFTMTSHSSLS